MRSTSVHERISPEIVPVRSIDQLYLQAITLRPFLSRLILKWALECNGFFKVHCSSRDSPTSTTPQSTPDSQQEVYFRKWSELQDEMAVGSFTDKISLATVKKIPRTLEKIQRCYKGDVSQLTDLCRGGQQLVKHVSS